MAVSDSNIRLVRSLLVEYPSDEISGAELNQLIRDRVPDLDVRTVVDIPTGSGALSKFVQDYLADLLKQIGRRGSDRVFQIVRPAKSGSTHVAAADLPEDLWGAFVSVSGNLHLYFNRLSQRLVASLTEHIGDENLEVIPPLTQVEHFEIARQFANQLPDEVSEEAGNILHEPNYSYSRWVSLLRDAGGGIWQQWGLFRVEHVMGLLRNRLSCANASDIAIEACVAMMRRSQSEVHRLRKVAARGASLKSQVLAASSERLVDDVYGAGLAILRAIAHDAVEIMDAEKLRAITFSVGELADSDMRITKR